MRTLSLTIFVFVALQGMASATTASASPLTEEPAMSAGISSSRSADISRYDVQEARAGSSARTTERKSPRSDAQARSYPRPKPVQIYWFFGGR